MPASAATVRTLQVFGLLASLVCSAADHFILDSVVGGDTITDFTRGLDKLAVDQFAIRVGNRASTLDGATTVSGPGGFGPNAELVVVKKNISAISATATRTRTNLIRYKPQQRG